MSLRTFQNNAVDVKDVWTGTVAGTWTASTDTATITINGKSLVVTIGSLVTTAQVAVTVKEAFASASSFTDTTASCIPQGGGQSIPEMAKYLATVSGSVVTLTERVAGRPGTITMTESTTSTGTLTAANSVPATGKYFGDNVKNWLEGSLPVDGDDIVVNGPYKWLYGMGFSAVQPASITFGERCTGVTQVGLPWENAAGYAEYRTPELAIGPLIVNVRGPVGLVKLNLGSDPCTANIYSSGTSLDTGYAPIQIRGTNATPLNTINAFGGNTSFAARGETAVLLAGRQSGSGRLTIGNNVTFTTISGTVTVVAD